MKLRKKWNFNSLGNEKIWKLDAVNLYILALSKRILYQVETYMVNVLIFHNVSINCISECSLYFSTSFFFFHRFIQHQKEFFLINCLLVTKEDLPYWSQEAQRFREFYNYILSHVTGSSILVGNFFHFYFPFLCNLVI